MVKSGPILCAVLCLGLRSARAQTADGGIWLGPVNISPFLNASVLYDSNVDFVREGEEDALRELGRDKEASGYALQPGFNLLLPGNHWQLDGTAFYKLEEYSADSQDSRENWSESLTWHGETDQGLGLRLSQTIQQVAQDTSSLENRWDDRLEMRFGADINKRLTDKTKVGVSGFYDELDYDHPDLFDWDRKGGRLTLSSKLTDKTDGLLVGGFTTHSSDGHSGNADSFTANIGMASRPTAKTTYRTTFGVEHYTGFDGEDSEIGLSYNIGMQWQAAERVSFNVSGRSMYEPAEDIGQNSMLVSTLGVSMNYRPLARWDLLVGGAYRREDYTRKVASQDTQMVSTDTGGRSRTDDQLNGHARVTYGLNRYASLFAGGNYTYTTSSIDDYDYTRWRVNAGVALRY